MTRTRLGLLGLCAMLFGLMAFTATAAHAEVGAKWLLAKVENEKDVLIPFLPASIDLETDVPGVLHSKILGIEVLFLCTTIKAVNAKLLEEGSIGSVISENPETHLKLGLGAKVKFSGCTTDLNGALAKECEPKDTSEEGGAGIILTKPGHALLKLHVLKITDEPGGPNEKKLEIKHDIVKILPDTGETFATIQLPAGCPIGTSVPVIGSLALQDCKELGLTHLVKHLVEQFAALTELWTISKTNEHKATLLGSAWAFLTGAHEGLKFSGDPA